MKNTLVLALSMFLSGCVIAHDPYYPVDIRTHQQVQHGQWNHVEHNHYSGGEEMVRVVFSIPQYTSGYVTTIQPRCNFGFHNSNRYGGCVIEPRVRSHHPIVSHYKVEYMCGDMRFTAYTRHHVSGSYVSLNYLKSITILPRGY